MPKVVEVLGEPEARAAQVAEALVPEAQAPVPVPAAQVMAPAPVPPAPHLKQLAHPVTLLTCARQIKIKR
ncbi:hypothetical protein J6524_02055 [Bradyrhizobium sp. WSM 1738]|uniref:hypothetical protein n=1 Tax=Bradyrhizobium hereditatis TaxID=2821405 RepID=UPI001CE34C65|nr:hypothetical protein [Bradyrhizobium hereditatis]MCA6113717.1 hypothetical protein [Bradyrhizobium hereditatis]